MIIKCGLPGKIIAADLHLDALGVDDLNRRNGVVKNKSNFLATVCREGGRGPYCNHSNNIAMETHQE